MICRQDWIILACAVIAVLVAMLPIWLLALVFASIAAGWMACRGIVRILDGAIDPEEDDDLLLGPRIDFKQERR